MSFKEKYEFEARKIECNRIQSKYPDRIPIIIEKHRNCKNLDNIDKNKYLVPNDLTVGQFIYSIRRRINISSDKAIYIFTESGKIPATNSFLSVIYENEKDDDGFLYFKYSGESTFG